MKNTLPLILLCVLLAIVFACFYEFFMMTGLFIVYIVGAFVMFVIGYHFPTGTWRGPFYGGNPLNWFTIWFKEDKKKNDNDS